MVEPKKSLGQNFLRDANIARKIVEHLEIQEGDTVLEIGPGSGALTKYLVQQARTVIGVEIDERAVRLLEETFGTSVRIVKQNILDVRLDTIRDEAESPLRVIGNIPYYITSDILFWLFDNRLHLRDATLMVQLEVAQRLTAKPRTKEYGILSIFSSYYAHPSFLFRVSRNCFYPKPNVDSAVISLRFDKELINKDERLFRNVVRGTFGKRRKTLFNGLKYLGFDERVLKNVQFDLSKRPEELSVEQFLELVRLLKPYKNKHVLTKSSPYL